MVHRFVQANGTKGNNASRRGKRDSSRASTPLFTPEHHVHRFQSIRRYSLRFLISEEKVNSTSEIEVSRDSE